MDHYNPEKIVDIISTSNSCYYYVIEKKNDNDYRIYFVYSSCSHSFQAKNIRFITNGTSHRKAKKLAHHLINAFNEGYNSNY